MVVQLNKGWAASARERGNSALACPLFPDELLNDLRDSASLESGMARQIGSGGAPLGPYKPQDNIAIEVTSSLAGTKLNTRQIDKPHPSGPLMRMHRNPS